MCIFTQLWKNTEFFCKLWFNQQRICVWKGFNLFICSIPVVPSVFAFVILLKNFLLIWNCANMFLKKKKMFLKWISISKKCLNFSMFNFYIFEMLQFVCQIKLSSKSLALLLYSSGVSALRFKNRKMINISRQ